MTGQRGLRDIPPGPKPSWRKPFGILVLLLGLAAYTVLIVGLSDPISRLPVLVQTIAYVVLGVVWILPLGRFLQWMETGRFR